MKKAHKKILSIIIVLIILGIVGYIIQRSPESQMPSGNNISASCEENNGKWLSDYNECEGIGQNWCEENDGEFFECESACRHDPEADFCTMQCVQVCKFDQ